MTWTWCSSSLKIKPIQQITEFTIKEITGEPSVQRWAPWFSWKVAGGLQCFRGLWRETLLKLIKALLKAREKNLEDCDKYHLISNVKGKICDSRWKFVYFSKLCKMHMTVVVLPSWILLKITCSPQTYSVNQEAFNQNCNCNEFCSHNIVLFQMHQMNAQRSYH